MPGVPSSALHKPGVWAHAGNLSIEEGQKFEAVLSYIASLKPAYTIGGSV